MYQGAVQDLIDELGRLPGVGPKSAQRIAFHILNSPAEEMEKLSAAITTVKRKVSFCEICGNISETPKCSICRDARRDTSLICVVEEAGALWAMERSGAFRGKYHVLGGLLSALDGVGPEHLRIAELVGRVRGGGVREVVLALPATVDGQTTAHYVAERIAGDEVQVTSLARGVPVGGDLDWLDDGTIVQALRARRPA